MIIFGLGNPGLKYRSTRHNAGYTFLNRFAKKYKKKFRTQKGYKVTTLKIDKNVIYLIKPQCWMNQSGMAISSLLLEIKENFLVVVDDINLTLGKIRLKSKGSDGGHLGLRSINEFLQTSNFARLRIGVGPPEDDVVSYVLTSFKRKEKKVLMSVIREGMRGIEILLRQGFVKAQNYINAIDLVIKSEARNPKP